MKKYIICILCLVISPILFLTRCVSVGPWGGVAISDPLGINDAMNAMEQKGRDGEQARIFKKAMANAKKGDPFAQVFVAEYREYYDDKGTFLGVERYVEHSDRPQSYINSRIAWLKKAQAQNAPLAWCAMSELFWREGESAKKHYVYSDEERIRLLEKAISLDPAGSGMSPLLLSGFYSHFASGDIDTSARILYDSAMKGNLAALSELVTMHHFFNFSPERSASVHKIWDCVQHPDTGACQVHAKLPGSLSPALQREFADMDKYSNSALPKISSCISQFDIPAGYKHFRNY